MICFRKCPEKRKCIAISGILQLISKNRIIIDKIDILKLVNWSKPETSQNSMGIPVIKITELWILYKYENKKLVVKVLFLIFRAHPKK